MGVGVVAKPSKKQIKRKRIRQLRSRCKSWYVAKRKRFARETKSGRNPEQPGNRSSKKLSGRHGEIKKECDTEARCNGLVSVCMHLLQYALDMRRVIMLLWAACRKKPTRRTTKRDECEWKKENISMEEEISRVSKRQ